MSQTKLRNLSLDEQIAAYEEQIRFIDARIQRAMEQKRVIRKHIRRLSQPDAELKFKQRQQQREKSLRQNQMRGTVSKKNKEQFFAKVHEKMQREVEECLRMNGKIV